MKTVLEGLRHSLAKPVVKKEPVTVEMLEAMVRDAEESGTLSDVRLTTACLLAFSGFLRARGLVNLKPYNCTLTSEILKVNNVESKTDQLRQGSELLIVWTSSSTCSVAMLERYMARTGMCWASDQFIFRPI